MNKDYPIVLGLAGQAASGKTITAKTLSRPVLEMVGAQQSLMFWTHLAYALPLYRMSTARQKIQGDDQKDRLYYELHAALDDLFRRGVSYEDLVEMVYDVSLVPCPIEGKPREFLQFVGTDICRAADPHCFINWMARKITEEFMLFNQEQDRAETLAELEDPDTVFHRQIFGVVIDDLRFPNECQLVKEHPNGILIRLNCRPEVRHKRLEDRDGYFNPESLSHISEKQLELVPDDWYTAVIDTSDLSVQEQMEEIEKVIMQHI